MPVQDLFLASRCADCNDHWLQGHATCPARGLPLLLPARELGIGQRRPLHQRVAHTTHVIAQEQLPRWADRLTTGWRILVAEETTEYSTFSKA